MREQDLPYVMMIEKRAYPHPWTEGIMSDCLRVGYHCQVLEVNDVVQAYGIMSVGAGESHILNLCVRPEVQNQGFGRKMLQHLLDLAQRLHADTALLEVRPSNHKAIRLYQLMGFNEVGMRKAYYPDHSNNHREDALIFARKLG